MRQRFLGFLAMTVVCLWAALTAVQPATAAPITSAAVPPKAHAATPVFPAAAVAQPFTGPGALALLSLQQAHLTGSGSAEKRFGNSVAIDGDTALVGAYADDTVAVDAGSVYVYVRVGDVWSQRAQLTAADGAPSDHFGYSVSLDGDTALIGAGWDDDPIENSGSAYVFVRSGAVWTQQAKLTASDGSGHAFFGASVALSGETALIGAFFGETEGVDVDTGSAYVFVRSGTAWLQQAKLAAADAARNDYFGHAVALSGETALVGALYGDAEGHGADTGSAYVFLRSGASWSQQAELNAADAAVNDRFACSVALDGDTALVGADSADSVVAGSGSAYVFTRSGTTWSQQTELTAADGAAADEFGAAVALSGDTALVGARLGDGATAGSGSAYVFTRSGTAWTQQAELTAADSAAADEFGDAVALSGSSALVGAPWDDTMAANGGSALVFVASAGAWSQQAHLTTVQDRFGYAVAIDDDTALVGADAADSAAVDAGCVYVFARSGAAWTQQSVLTSTDGAAYDHFGCAVALAGDTAVIGASNDDAGAEDSGSAYVFVRNGTTWSQQAKLTAGDGAAVDLFGSAVALSGETALIGARGHDTYEADAGAAYVFTRSGGAWTPQGEHLTAWDGAASDLFGCSLALSGDTALVGAGWDDGEYSGVGVPPADLGSAYVFKRSAGVWSEQAHLTASNPATFDYFGAAVALDDGVALIGAFGRDTARNGAGAAFVFAGSGALWTQQAELTALDANYYDAFGSSVSLSGGTAVVGACGDDDDSVTPRIMTHGSAYVFSRDGALWRQQTKLTAADRAAGDDYGHAVALSGDTAVVGAFADDTVVADTGSAYAYLLDGLAPVTTARIDPTPTPGGWNDGPATVTLTAADAVSGVAWTRFRPQGAVGWTTYSAPFPVTEPGSWTYQFHSRDLAGNEGPVQAVTVGVEGAPPTTAASVTPAPNAKGWNKSPVTVTLAATDAVSGVAATSCRRRPATAWAPYAAPLPISVQGVSTLEFFSRDAAGHEEATQSIVLRIDRTRPATKAYAAKAEKGKRAKIRYKVADAVPGCGKATVTLKVYRGKKLKKTLRSGLCACNVRMTHAWRCTLARGRYTIKVYATDIAGNAQRRVGSAKLTVN